MNKLKLNKDKTELLVISSLHRAQPPLSDIHVCDEKVLASPSSGKHLSSLRRIFEYGSSGDRNVQIRILSSP